MLHWKAIIKRRVTRPITKKEFQLIKSIRHETSRLNLDNVSRTHAYLKFYKRFNDIEWALLASMVSRNAGWNMVDLRSEGIFKLLSDHYLKVLFHTYERPNWLIFHDAYPQLLLYSASTVWKQPLFHLLKFFNVSPFMEMEWESYWLTKDGVRLCYALIVNEQHVIEQPVMEHQYFRNQVFARYLFKIEELLKLNAVVFPDTLGSLYGFPVAHFRDVASRIDLGKRLHALLFFIPEAKEIRRFALDTEHTGDRYDYEKYHNASSKNQSLREVYKVIHHRRLSVTDWFQGEVNPEWFEMPVGMEYHLTSWYRRKRNRLNRFGNFISYLVNTEK